MSGAATKRVERVALPSPSAGTRRELVFHRYGRAGASPKAYLQASLHADETPAMLVSHHLVRRLDAEDAAGRIAGEIVVLPVANPIGLDQEVGAAHAGRHELAGGSNFNRFWPDLSDAAAALLAGKIGADPAANERAVRTALGEAAAALAWRNPLGAMKAAIMARAADAHIALDLHCDSEALLYLYLARDPSGWRAGEDLHRWIGGRATLLSEDAGGQSFEDVLSGTWRKLALRFGAAGPIPRGCLAATIELRGQADVDDATAAGDADRILRFLVGRRAVAGDPGAMPEPAGEAVALEAVDLVRAPRAGLVVHTRALGERVKAGDTVAELVDLDDPQAPRAMLATETDGFVLSRAADRLVRPGQVVIKVVGREVLASRTGALLED